MRSLCCHRQPSCPGSRACVAGMPTVDQSRVAKSLRAGAERQREPGRTEWLTQALPTTAPCASQHPAHHSTLRITKRGERDKRVHLMTHAAFVPATRLLACRCCRAGGFRARACLPRAPAVYTDRQRPERSANRKAAHTVRKRRHRLMLRKGGQPGRHRIHRRGCTRQCNGAWRAFCSHPASLHAGGWQAPPADVPDGTQCPATE